MCLLRSLTPFKTTKEYDNTRDYPMRSFYMSVRYPPSLLLLILDVTSYNKATLSQMIRNESHYHHVIIMEKRYITHLSLEYFQLVRGLELQD